MIALLLLGTACRSAEGPAPINAHALEAELLAAIIDGKEAAAVQLLQRGANPNAVKLDSHDQPTVLMAALSGNHMTLVEQLIDRGADVNLREGATVWGRTPLMLAAATGNAEAITLLVSKGARVEARAGAVSEKRDVEGGTTSALAVAVEAGQVESARLLLLAGAKIERAQLQAAIHAGHADLVRLLMRCGADSNWIFANGRTAWQETQLAPSATQAEIAEALRRFGALAK